MTADIRLTDDIARVLNERGVGVTTAWSPLLGSGEYSSTYACTVDGGTPAVVKLTHTRRDAKICKDLHDLRDQVPRRLRKHVMVVHDLVEIDTKYDDLIYAVVVERLTPLPRNDVETYWLGKDPDVTTVDWNSSEEDQLRKGLEVAENDPKFSLADALDLSIESTVKRARVKYKSFTRQPDLFPPWMTDGEARAEFVVDIMPKIKDAIRDGKLERLIDDIGSDEEKKFDELISKFPDDPDKQDELAGIKWNVVQLTIIFGSYLRENLYELLSPHGRFPRRSLVDQGFFRRKVKTGGMNVRSFLDFLRWLRDSELYDWDDVHNENVMLRPSTGDWVLSDPGLFTDIREEKKKSRDR